MKAYHRVPCKECPWRTDSLKGYLGGWPPEAYADAVHAGVITACHQRDDGPENDNTAFCAGAASVMANTCAMPRETEAGQAGAAAFRNRVGKRTDTFANVGEFYEYHSGAPYLPPILRPRALIEGEALE